MREFHYNISTFTFLLRKSLHFVSETQKTEEIHTDLNKKSGGKKIAIDFMNCEREKLEFDSDNIQVQRRQNKSKLI